MEPGRSESIELLILEVTFVVESFFTEFCNVDGLFVLQNYEVWRVQIFY